MMSFYRLAWSVLAAVLLAAGAAQAHPHVWIQVKSELVYAPDGSATGVRHHWTFDEMFSTFATQGIQAKAGGALTREDLAPLAEVNITSMKDFQFFTFALADGKRFGFKEPTDYWLEQKDGALTLHFMLPFAAPTKAKQLSLEIYDSTYFVDFALAEKDPAALVSAPAACKLAVYNPRGKNDAAAPLPSETMFEKGAAGNYGAQFSNKIAVNCP